MTFGRWRTSRRPCFFAHASHAAPPSSNDSANPGSAHPIIFRVLGDGKLLWQSYGLHRGPQDQPCMLDITGVDVLRLRRFVQGVPLRSLLPGPKNGLRASAQIM